tara:strand:+ start:380 stop:532 length:153 start_codon:yes stop_codon:yes gene_type:complete
MIIIYGSPRLSLGRYFWCSIEVEEKYSASSIGFKEKEYKFISTPYLSINP